MTCTPSVWRGKPPEHTRRWWLLQLCDTHFFICESAIIKSRSCRFVPSCSSQTQLYSTGSVRRPIQWWLVDVYSMYSGRSSWFWSNGRPGPRDVLEFFSGHRQHSMTHSSHSSINSTWNRTMGSPKATDSLFVCVCFVLFESAMNWPPQDSLKK